MNYYKQTMNVLCITHSADHYTVDIVEKALASQGSRMLRFNTDLFGIDGDLSFELTTNKNATQSIRIGSMEFDSIDAVWYRKIWRMTVPPQLSPEYHAVFTKEYRTWMQVFFESISHLPWLNPLETDHLVGTNKFKQLKLAAAAGLVIPDTICTNNPEHVKKFFEKQKSRVIMKLHNALSQSMKGDQAFFPTTVLTEAGLQQLSSLRYCPMIFQQQIEKQYELRIAYVDGHFFTGKINTQHLQHGKTDWRATSRGEAVWETYELPQLIQAKISTLMRSADLPFGVIDMIHSVSGDYVFLEVNPQGEWGMLQRDLGYMIGEQIADTIIKRVNNETTINTHHYA